MIAPRRQNVMADRRIRLAEIVPMHARPVINLRSLGWSLVALIVCTALMGLLTVGKA